MTDKDESGSPYELPGVSNNFTSKTHDIFGCLDTIEAKHNAFQAATKRSGSKSDEKLWKDEPSFDYLGSDKGKGRTDRQGGNSCVRGQLGERDSGTRGQLGERDSGNHGNNRGGEFVKPRGLPPRYNRKPDHIKNPQNYQFYDLSDITKGDMSERSNTAAAFEFLNSRKDAHLEENMDVEPNEDRPVFTFKKPLSKPKNDTSCSGNSNNDSPLQLGYAKHVMPEYVVGASSKPKPKKQLPKISNTNAEVNIESNLELPDVEEDADDKTESEKAGNSVISFKKRGKGKSGFRGRGRNVESDDEEKTHESGASSNCAKRSHSSPENSDDESISNEHVKKPKNRMYNRPRVEKEDGESEGE